MELFCDHLVSVCGGGMHGAGGSLTSDFYTSHHLSFYIILSVKANLHK